MNRLTHLMVFLLIIAASACSDGRQGQLARPLPDTSENRTQLAKQYLAIMPPGQMLHGAADIAAKAMPEQKRKIFMDLMYSKGLEESTYLVELDTLVNRFTAAELQALIAFYGSPEGKSAQEKLRFVTMEAMTHIQNEVKKGMEAAGEKLGAPPPAPKVQPAPPGPGQQGDKP